MPQISGRPRTLSPAVGIAAIVKSSEHRPRGSNSPSGTDDELAGQFINRHTQPRNDSSRSTSSNPFGVWYVTS